MHHQTPPQQPIFLTTQQYEQWLQLMGANSNGVPPTTLTAATPTTSLQQQQQIVGPVQLPPGMTMVVAHPQQQQPMMHDARAQQQMQQQMQQQQQLPTTQTFFYSQPQQQQQPPYLQQYACMVHPPQHQQQQQPSGSSAVGYPPVSSSSATPFAPNLTMSGESDATPQPTSFPNIVFLSPEQVAQLQQHGPSFLQHQQQLLNQQYNAIANAQQQQPTTGSYQQQLLQHQYPSGEREGSQQALSHYPQQHQQQSHARTTRVINESRHDEQHQHSSRHLMAHHGTAPQSVLPHFHHQGSFQFGTPPSIEPRPSSDQLNHGNHTHTTPQQQQHHQSIRLADLQQATMKPMFSPYDTSTSVGMHAHSLAEQQSPPRQRQGHNKGSGSLKAKVAPTYLPSPTSNVIVNFLPRDMTRSRLREIFGAAGEVKSVRIVKRKHLGDAHQDYAFVLFAKFEGAERAMRELQGFPLEGKTLKISFAETKPRHYEPDASTSTKEGFTTSGDEEDQEGETDETNTTPQQQSVDAAPKGGRTKQNSTSLSSRRKNSQDDDDDVDDAENDRDDARAKSSLLEEEEEEE